MWLKFFKCKLLINNDVLEQKTKMHRKLLALLKKKRQFLMGFNHIVDAYNGIEKE